MNSLILFGSRVEADDRIIGVENHLGGSCFANFPSDLVIDGIADGNIAQEAAFRGRAKVERFGDNFIEPVPAYDVVRPWGGDESLGKSRGASVISGAMPFS